MCSDKSYEESAYCKFNYHYQPIPVSSNVEYVMLITYVLYQKSCAILLLPQSGTIFPELLLSLLALGSRKTLLVSYAK